VKRSTWILLAVVLVLAGVVFFWERKVPTTDELKESKDRLISIKTTGVTELKREGTSPLHLVKDGDKWKLLAPVKDGADRYRVEGFLDRLGSAKVIRRLKIKAGSGKYGLKNPKATWTISGTGFSHTIKVGKKASIEGIYAESDSSLVVVSNDVAKQLSKVSNDFRLKNLLPFGTDEVQGCSIKRGGEKFSFTRNGGDEWKITAPFTDRGNATKVQELLDDVCLCPVFSFVDDGGVGDKDAGLVSPAVTIALALKNGKKVLVKLGGEVKGGDPKKKLIYASAEGRPSIMEVSRNSLRFLRAKPTDYRSMDLFTHALYDAEKVSIHGLHSVVIKRNARNEWEFIEPENPPEGADASVLVAGVSALKAKGVADGDRKSMGLAKPLYTINVKGKDFLDTLEVGKEVNGSTFAAPGGRKVILRLENDGLSRLKESIKLATKVGKKKGKEAGK